MAKGFNFMDYVKYLVSNKLNKDYYSIEDCCQQIHLALWCHKSGKFKQCYQTNTVPKGDDLKLLKSIVYNQKLAFLHKENKIRPYQYRKWELAERTNNEEQYND